MLATTLMVGCALSQPHNANPIDPRHHVDKRCFAALSYDPADKQRDPAMPAEYLWTAVASNTTVEECGRSCCGDWSCLSFALYDSSIPSQCHVTSSLPKCCAFMDAIAPSINKTIEGRMTGVRSFLPSTTPPNVPTSSYMSAHIEPTMILGVDGDEFPTTWGRDGLQYSGAGDNQQPKTDTHPGSNSPLSFFKIKADSPTDLSCSPVPGQNPAQPSCKNMTLQGNPIVVNSTAAMNQCPKWFGHPIPNLKSSSVISIEGVLYWAVSCFNYGDDPVFNRQRYGPAWIISSHDYGVTFNQSATPTNMFPDRLAAPRFIQFGKDNTLAKDGFVYVYFPCTNGNAAFFENNDMILLGRVPSEHILDVSKYEYYMGKQADGTVVWTTDSTIAQPIWEHSLMTSVQQVNYHPDIDRYIFANWAWISADGNPRPDHTGDETYGRTARQRTQLLLVESPTPWGPFSIFYRNDNWQAADGSRGGYTPVFPPAWMKETYFAMVSTQCCGSGRSGYTYNPTNNYNFLIQNVSFHRL